MVTRLHRIRSLALSCAIGGAFSLGCDDQAPVAKTAHSGIASPNASGVPAPLEPADKLLELPATRAATSVEPGVPAHSAARMLRPVPELPPPEAFRSRTALPPDTLTPTEAIGARLRAEFIWQSLPDGGAQAAPNQEAAKAARASLALDVEIDIVADKRLRLALKSPAFPLPMNTEFRARANRYGHVLVWPKGNKYRVLLPGAARTLFLEQRPDVTPLAPTTALSLPEGDHSGRPLHRVRLESHNGTMEMGSAMLEGASGQLLCRFLLELLTLSPTSDHCQHAAVPLNARYSWNDGGRLEFRVTHVSVQQEIGLAAALVPPELATFRGDGLPLAANGVLLPRGMLAGLRDEAQPRKTPLPAGSPKRGLIAQNDTDRLMYLFLDGVPVSWVRPHSKQTILGPKAGIYNGAWRDFTGNVITTPRSEQLPALVPTEAIPDPEDAGAP